MIGPHVGDRDELVLLDDPLGCPAGWSRPRPLSAARMSARTIRPRGPVPVIPAGEMPFSAASLRASGEILIAAAGGRRGRRGSLGRDGRGRTGTKRPALAPRGRLRREPREPASAPERRPFLRLSDRAEPAADRDLGSRGTKIFSSVPSKKHSSSIVALSVSTSASMSPLLTASPSLLEPLDQRAHRHGVAELRHFDDFGHVTSSPRGLP